MQAQNWTPTMPRTLASRMIIAVFQPRSTIVTGETNIISAYFRVTTSCSKIKYCRKNMVNLEPLIRNNMHPLFPLNNHCGIEGILHTN